MKYILTTIILLLFLACSKSTPIPEPEPVHESYLSPKALQQLNFNGQELITVKIKNDFYYIRKDGKKMFTLTYDDKADEFSDGLARTKVDGKIGFFNANLDIVLKPIYDFAFPFHHGTAEICMGCKEKAGSMLDGGKWKKINRDGLVIE